MHHENETRTAKEALPNAHAAGDWESNGKTDETTALGDLENAEKYESFHEIQIKDIVDSLTTCAVS